MISGVEKLVLTKKEKDFIINTIHKLFGFIGSLDNEISDSLEFNHMYICSLNLPRVLEKVLAIENSKDMREEYYSLHH